MNDNQQNPGDTQKHKEILADNQRYLLKAGSKSEKACIIALFPHLRAKRVARREHHKQQPCQCS